MRTALLLAVCLAPAAWAQAISGTFSGAFVDFNEFGVPRTQLTLSLSCALTCDASAPTLRYGVAGGASAAFVGAPTESTGYIGSGFGSDPSGQNSVLSEQFHAGTAFTARAKSCTCHCGNRTGEGGYVDLTTPVIAIPPYLAAGTARVGDEYSSIIVNAEPRGGDSVVVQLSGGGLDETRTLTQADFGTQQSQFVRFTPTVAGAMSITATLQPYGATFTTTLEVKPRSSSGGTGGGGGSSSGTGGGSGGGGADSPFGCATSPVGAMALLVAAWVRRVRRA